MEYRFGFNPPRLAERGRGCSIDWEIFIFYSRLLTHELITISNGVKSQFNNTNMDVSRTTD